MSSASFELVLNQLSSWCCGWKTVSCWRIFNLTTIIVFVRMICTIRERYYYRIVSFLSKNSKADWLHSLCNSLIYLVFIDYLATINFICYWRNRRRITVERLRRRSRLHRRRGGDGRFYSPCSDCCEWSYIQVVSSSISPRNNTLTTLERWKPTRFLSILYSQWHALRKQK